MTKLTRTGPSSWALEGELTFATVTRMLTSAPKVDPTKPTLVDLSGLTRGDSAGLSLLVEWLVVARASGGVLRYTGLPENFSRLARVAGLDFLDSYLEEGPELSES
jgi:phospholipid transport system transporter-binding protein